MHFYLMLFAHPGISHLAFQSLYCCVGEHYFPVSAFCFRRGEMSFNGNVAAYSDCPFFQVYIFPGKRTNFSVTWSSVNGQ
ncbi:Uncharacterised protein [Klebsiella aerogenes]|nr:Uncharacterised protein [Klebsiella aerogenes]